MSSLDFCMPMAVNFELEDCALWIRLCFYKPVVHNKRPGVIFSRHMSLSLGTVRILFIRDWNNSFFGSLYYKWCPQCLHRSFLNICLCFRTAVRSYINAWSSHNRSPALVFQTWQNVIFDSNTSLIGSVTTLQRKNWTLYSSFLT